MLDKLVDLLVQFLDLFMFVRVVDHWEAGVVLRFGRFHREVGPGWHMLFPLRMERLVTADMYPIVHPLPAQSLTTADGVAVVVSAVVTFRVRSVRRALLECGGHEESLLESTAGALAQHVTAVHWRDLVTEEFGRTITTEVGRRAKPWGIKILSVQLRDVVRCRSLRVFGSPLH